MQGNEKVKRYIDFYVDFYVDFVKNKLFYFDALKIISKYAKENEMKKKHIKKSKKLLILPLAVVIALLAMMFAMSTFAEDSSDNVWTFTSDSVKDPPVRSKVFYYTSESF